MNTMVRNFNTQYLTSEYLEGSASTVFAPTVQASNINFGNITGSAMSLNWTNGNGTARIVVGRANHPVEVEPQDLTNYNWWGGAFGSNSYNIGNSEHKVLYMGNGSSVSVTNLTGNTTYHYAIFEYNGNNGKVYLRPGTRGSQLTASTPTTASTNIRYSNIDGDRFYYNFDGGNGSRRLVIAKKGSPVTALPEDGVFYTANTTFGSGQEIAPDEFVVYNGTGSASWLYGLEHSTTYHLAIFEFNENSSETFYLTDAYLQGSRATLSPPTLQAHDFVFSNITGSSMTINWTNGNGTGRILVGRADNPVEVEPQDLTNYNWWQGAFGSNSYNIGNTEHKVLYMGSGSSVNITNLNPDKTYHFAIFEYTGSNGKLYLRPGSTGNQKTVSSPTVAPSNLRYSNIDGDRFYYNFDSGNGQRRLVIAKKESPVTALPEDGLIYTANTTFGAGQEIAPDEFVVYNGTGSASWLYRLEHSTTYHLAIFEYNISGTETYYLTDLYLQGSRATLFPPTLQAENLVFSNITGSGMTINWTNGNGNGRILVGRADNPVEVEPQDLINYSSWAGAFGSTSYNIGNSEHKVLYVGGASGVNITNLDPDRTYHFAIFEYTGSNGRLYLRPGTAGNQTTASSPTLAASNMRYSNIDGDRFYYNFDGGNGQRRVVIARKESPVTALPENGLIYTASTTFGAGQEIAPGEFVVYNGTGSASWLYGLEPATTYHLAVFEFNQNSTSTFYLTDPYLAGNRATLSHPTVQSSNAFTSSRSNTSINISWTRGDGSHRILIGRKDGPVNVEPQDFANYTASATFGQRQIGTENYVLFTGTGNNVNVTNLEPGTNYYFALFEYNGNNAKLYLRPGYQFAIETYGERPTVQVSNATYSNIDFTSFDVAFTPGNGSRRLVLAREGSSVNAGPNDFVTYTANNTFSLGDEIGSGNFVVYNGFGDNFHLDGLSPTTTYFFSFFEYSFSEQGELYMAPAYTSVQASKASYDLSLSKILAPQSGCELTSAETVTVEITNMSTSTVEALQVAYTLNGTDVVLENLSGSNLIPGNGKYIHSFTTPADLSEKGIYILTAYLILEDDINPDNDSNSLQIIHFQDPVTSVSEDSTICKGSTAELTASGGINYLWSTGETTAGISVSPEFTTIYSVIITDSNGCSAEEEVTVYVLDVPDLLFVGEGNYEDSYVYPQVGTIDSTFTFKVLYRDSEGLFPTQGFPKVVLQSFLETLELEMVEADPADIDVTNGKIYVASVSGLSPDAVWSSSIISESVQGCIIQTPPTESPLVTKRVLDISIFANDILFSNDEPALNEVFTVTARINNTSDFPAENFDVNIYHNTELVLSIPVDYVAPRSVSAIMFDYSFTYSGLHEIKVFLDKDQVLQEQNPLNNFAIRLYTLPEGITVSASLDKNVYKIGETMYLSGIVRYIGTDVAASAVAGAKVDIALSDGRNRTVYTRNNGTFSTSFSVPVTTGDFTITGEVDEGRFKTSFVIGDGTDGFSFTVVDADAPETFADLVARMIINTPGGRDYFLQGESVTGTARVENKGNAVAENFIVRYSNCESVLGEVFVESLSPGEIIEFPFSTVLNNVTNCTSARCRFTIIADVLKTVDEKFRDNNSHEARVKLYSILPDLVPDFHSSSRDQFGYYYTLKKPFNFGVSAINIGGGNISESFNLRVYIDGVLFKDTIINELSVCEAITLRDLEFQFNDMQNHLISIRVDEPIGSGNIHEFREDNNVLNIDVRYRVVKPDLATSRFRLSVEPKFPLPGEEFTITGEFSNKGGITTSSPFTTSFTINEDGEERTEEILVSTLLAPKDTASVSITSSIYEYGNHFVSFLLDVYNEIDEVTKNNNSGMMPLCVDLRVRRDPVYNFRKTVWDGNFQVFTQQYLTAYIGNLGLFVPSDVKVHFYLDDNLIASTVIDEVPTTYSQLGIYIKLPYIFSEAGIFTLKVVVDPDNEFIECNELNNEYSQQITINTPGPDLQVLPQYISPSRLNPDIGEPINVFVSFDNIGAVPAGPFKVRLTVDNVQLGEDVMVNGLDAGFSSTVAIPQQYSSNIGGFKTLRAYIDVDNQLNDANIRNNVAERQIFVGNAPNLLFKGLTLSKECPGNNEFITATAFIENEGDLSVTAQVNFYHKIGEDLLDITTEFIEVEARGKVEITFDYQVLSNSFELFGEISNASPFEFNELDNTITIPYCTTPVQLFAIQTSVEGEGIIIINPEESAYPAGSEITLTAVAASGWEFTRWTGDAEGEISQILVQVDSDKDITAVFTKTPTYLLTIQENPEAGGFTLGSGQYMAGTEVQLTATANEGYNFASWTRDETVLSTEAFYNFTMPAEDVTLVANFNEVLPEMYQLTLEVSPVSAGIVTGEGTYEAGDEVNLTATANEGYTFASWTRDETVLSTEAIYNFTMPAEDVTLVANFNEVLPEMYQLTLEVSPVGAGIVTGEGTYEAGDEVNLTATANEGYTFASWTMDGAVLSTEAFYNFTMPAEDVTLVANFNEVLPEMYQLTLEVSPVGAGIVTGEGTYEAGDEVNLTATANEGYNFASWTRDGAVLSTEAFYNFTMPAEDITLVANFNEVLPEMYQLTLEVSPVVTGIVFGAGEYEAGTEVNLTATANEGYTFASWTREGAVLSTEAIYNFTMPAEDVTLVANFTEVLPEMYQLTLEVSPVGAGIVTGEGTYEAGDEVNLTATANEGYTFASWTMDGAVLSTEAFYNFTMPAEDVTLVANFNEVLPEMYQLTLEVSPVGAGIVTGEGTYEAGDEVNLTATANEGYNFASWTRDGAVLSTEAFYNFTMPAEDITLVANFNEVLPEMYQLTLEVSPVVTGIVFGAGEYEAGTEVNLTATANEGYTFASWTREGAVLSTEAFYNFTMPAEDLTLVANFNEVLPEMYQLTLEVSPEGAGMVTGEGEYEEGEEVNLTATANEGYTFASWTREGAVLSTEAIYNFTMPAENTTLVANFVKLTFTIVASAGTGGSIDPSGNVVVEYDDSQSFTITPEAGFKIADVLVNGSSVGAVDSYDFENLTDNQTIHATFELLPVNLYTLTLLDNPIGAGILSGGGSYEEGELVPVSALANAGFEFVNWTRDEEVVSTSAAFNFEVPAENTTLVANFVKLTFTIVASAGAGGSIDPSGNVVVEYGDSQSFTITPEAGYKITDVLVNGSSVGAVAGYEFENVIDNQTIHATFELLPVSLYTLTLLDNPIGSGILSGGDSYEEDELAPLSAVANAGFEFVNWTRDGIVVSTLAAFDFVMPAENTTLVANFAKRTFTIAASAGAGGSIDPSGNVVVEYGDSQSFTITPEAGYKIADVLVNGNSVGAVAGYEFENVIDNQTIHATFELLPVNLYTLTLLDNPMGAGILSGGGSYEEDELVPVSAVANAGFEFVNWARDGIVVSTLAAFDFVMPAENTTLVANFAKRTFTIAASAGTGGSIDPSGNVVVEYGDSQSFTITPEAGFKIADVLVNGNSVGAVAGYDFENVTDNQTIHATFELLPVKLYTLTLLDNPIGAGILSGGGSYEEGELVPVSAVANAGYAFVNWTRDEEEVSTSAAFNFEMPGENVTLVANFNEVFVEPDTYTLTLEVSPADAGMVTGEGEYEEGEEVNLSATANEGYTFAGWTLMGEVISTWASFSYIMPAADITIVANFLKEFQAGYCSRSQGYWFSGNNIWPFDLVIGGLTFTIMFHREHTGKVIVHCPGKNGSQDNPDISYRPPHCTGNRPENRSQARYVQKLDQKYLPPGHGHIINTVGHGNGRGFSLGIGTENTFDIKRINSKMLTRSNPDFFGSISCAGRFNWYKKNPNQ
jgi:uncharacterized repeat protein (TIGR02543 family)